MLSKLTKMFKSQKGFTLVELMTVLIILAIVLAIGIPKYLQIQAKSGWEADANTIANFAKAAETYAASINKFDTDVKLEKLIEDGLIDGSTVLNRQNDGGNISIKNKGEGRQKNIDDYSDVPFSLNQKTGNVNNLGLVIQYMIGNPPYGEGPKYPGDDTDANWDDTTQKGVTSLSVETPDYTGK